MGKLKLVIADDEYYIRLRINKIIDWDNLPIEFFAEAENGQQVIDLLDKGVDILILDIKMPGLSGIDVAKYISENEIPTQVIILSGFSDFSFAQQLIRYGVSDYLLKPVDTSTLNNSIRLLIEKISLASSQNVSSSVQKYSDYQSALSDELNQTKFVEDYLNDFNHSCFVCVFTELKISSIKEALEQLADSSSFAVYLANQAEMSAIFQLFYNDINAVKSAINTLEVNSFVCIAKDFAIQKSWSRHFKLAQDNLLLRFFEPTSVVVDENAYIEPSKDYSINIRNDITKCLNIGNIEKFEEYINSIKESILSKNSIYYLKDVVYEIIATFSLVFPSEYNIRESLVKELGFAMNLDDLFEIILKLAAEQMEMDDVRPYNTIMSQKIAKYIDENYNNPDLTVKSVSKEFSLTPSYAGVIFRKIYNLSINQYINNVRINKACELLQAGDLKISEIALKTGFSDVYYFSRRFKINTGFSPTDYSKEKNSY